MLITRCPECDTTFRVTDDALKKANGQVRCGRCASVFNAYAELQDSSKASDGEPAPLAADAPAENPSTAQPTPVTSSATPAGESDAAQPGATSVGPAVVVAPVQTAPAAAATADDLDDLDLITDKAIDEVLTTNVGVGLSQDAPVWPTVHAEPAPQRPSPWWGAGALVAVFMLLGQVLHHYRSEIAGHPTFGPWIQQAYRLVGTELTPSWDVRQYEILDWVATAEPNSRGLGSLKITARIQNRGPLRQPYPAVQLRLKDRFEAAVSSRVFTPAEYLPGDSSRERLMSPGETARAEIEVVDPGPDAYGFELDVCIEVEASLVTCGTDEVFL
jgi:predicted Zn finger-like uncharacterized protein